MAKFPFCLISGKYTVSLNTWQQKLPDRIKKTPAERASFQRHFALEGTLAGDDNDHRLHHYLDVLPDVVILDVLQVVVNLADD